METNRNSSNHQESKTKEINLQARKTMNSKIKRRVAHLDEYEIYAELDFGDGFNAFDEDFYSNYYSAR